MSRTRVNPEDIVNRDDLDFITDASNPNAIDPNYSEGNDPYDPLDFDDSFDDDDFEVDELDIGMSDEDAIER